MEKISHIIESMINGQFEQAVELTTLNCKTKPFKMAHRVGQVVGSLSDPDGLYNDPDLAVRYLALFNE